MGNFARVRQLPTHRLGTVAIAVLVAITMSLVWLSVTRPPLVGIIAGHAGSGSGSGATCEDGLREVEITKAVAPLVVAQLEDAGYRVEVLSEFDQRLRGYRGAVLISLHADSCIPELSGFKVATNSDDSVTTDDLERCLWDRYETVTHLQKDRTHITDDMTSYHAFREVHRGMPAAIVELGYLGGDRQLLVDHPEIAARGISSGIRCFLEKWETR